MYENETIKFVKNDQASEPGSLMRKIYETKIKPYRLPRNIKEGLKKVETDLTFGMNSPVLSWPINVEKEHLYLYII